MSNLPRVTQKVFGEASSPVNNFIQFGSLAANAVVYTKDLAAIQSLAAFDLGWAGAVVGNKSPSLEDMNALFYLAFKQLAYLFQKGLPEWDPNSIYYTGNKCQVSGIEYSSKTNNNVGNDPTTDTNNWRTQASLALEFLYPIGEVYITHREGDPSVLLGFGTWSRIAEGQFPVMRSTTDSDFDTIGKTGGAKTHALASAELPTQLANLTHTILNIPGSSGTGVAQAGASGATYQNHGLFNGVGSGTPMPIVPPFNVLFNAWLRLT